MILTYMYIVQFARRHLTFYTYLDTVGGNYSQSILVSWTEFSWFGDYHNSHAVLAGGLVVWKCQNCDKFLFVCTTCMYVLVGGCVYRQCYICKITWMDDATCTFMSSVNTAEFASELLPFATIHVHVPDCRVFGTWLWPYIALKVYVFTWLCAHGIAMRNSSVKQLAGSMNWSVNL